MTRVLEITLKKVVNVQTSGDNEPRGATLRGKHPPAPGSLPVAVSASTKHHPSHLVCLLGLLYACF